MISESKIQLIESLINRIGKYEKTAPPITRHKLIMSASVSWVLFAFGCIVSLYFEDEAKLSMPKALWLYAAAIVGLVTFISSWAYIKFDTQTKLEFRDPQILELKGILLSMQKQLESTD